LSWLGRISCVFLLTLVSYRSYAQLPVVPIANNNLRQKTFKVDADSIRIDTISIVPNTFSVGGISPSDYRLDFVKAILYWNKKPTVESINISYRVFSFQLNPVAQRMRFDSVMNNFYAKPIEFNMGMTNAQRGIFDFGTLKAEGSFGRQIGFGNRQDAVLNSTLNLQLSGMLGDSIEIQAAITDNNIPLQPGGNTEQLNEFDQVYLKFKKRNWHLSLGAYNDRQSKNYFINLFFLYLKTSKERNTSV